MKRTEVYKWLEEGDKPGQKGQAIEDYIDIPNPDPVKRQVPQFATIKVKRVTWTRNDGQTLSVIDMGDANPTTPTVDPATGTTFYDPEYTVTKPPTGMGPADDNRSPEKKADDEELDRQRKKNASLPADQDPRWETDAERAARARQTRQDQDALETRNREAAAAAERNRISQEQVDISRDAEARQTETARSTAAAQAAQTALDRDKFNLDRDKANRPEVISKPTDEDTQIAIFRPDTGKIEAQDNPIYNGIKAAAQQKKEELALAIQARQIGLQEATAQYDRWYKENVEAPIKMAQERRAQAEAVRQAQAQQDQRDQFAAAHALDISKFGQTAGQNAAQNEIALLPYRTGASFAANMSSAINSLAHGGNLKNDASAGIHFSDSDFSFAAPDLQAIAAKGTAAALKGISTFDPNANGPIVTPDYSGIPQPMQAAPPPPATPGGPDIGQLWQGLYGTPPAYQYQPNAPAPQTP